MEGGRHRHRHSNSRYKQRRELKEEKKKEGELTNVIYMEVGKYDGKGTQGTPCGKDFL